MMRSVMLALVTTICLLSAPRVEAGKKPRCRDGGHRCTSAAQCCGGSCCNGTCCDGACTTDGTCCSALGGEVACGDQCCDALFGEACCNQAPYGQLCLDTLNDNRNCGACGNECTGGTVCINGSCTCYLGNVCDGLCVDPATDRDNCGGCGRRCPSGQTCQDGECVCTGFNDGCQNNEVCQNGQCVGVCLPPTPGSAIDGTYVACPDGHGGVFCGCGGCSEQCQNPTVCCHCGCKYISTTCAEFCVD